MRSTIVVLLAILLCEAYCIPIASEIEESEELCKSSGSENCPTTLVRDVVRRLLILMDTEEEEEIIQKPEVVLTENNLFTESISRDETRENYEIDIGVHISENKESTSYSESEEHSNRKVKVLAKRDTDYTQYPEETDPIYNEENDNASDENSGYPENIGNTPITGDTFENGCSTEENDQENLPLPQSFDPVDRIFTLNEDKTASTDQTDINEPMIDRSTTQTRHSKSAFPDYPEAADEEVGNSLDILYDLENIEDEGFDDLEENINILKEAESMLLNRTDDTLYPRFSISEEAHFARDSNITAIIGCGEWCGENVNQSLKDSEILVTEIRHEEIDLEIKILENDLGETTTPAIWNTGEFVDRTSRNYPLTKRDIDDEGNSTGEFGSFKSITESGIISFISIDHIFRSHFNDSDITSIYNNNTEVEHPSDVLDKLRNSTYSLETLENVMDNLTNQSPDFIDMSDEVSWKLNYKEMDQFDFQNYSNLVEITPV